MLTTTTVLAENRVYELTIAVAENGTYEPHPFEGLYVELEEPRVFQKLGGPDTNGHFHYLYENQSKDKWLMANRHKTSTQRRKAYWATGGNEPPAEGWKSKRSNNTKEGWKLTKQQGALASTLEQAEEGKGSVTLDGGVLCLQNKKQDDVTSSRDNSKTKTGSTTTKTWIMLEANDSRICDDNVDCEGAWDEDCIGRVFKAAKAVIIQGGESKTRGVYDLVRNNASRPLFYKRVDGWGFLRWWKGNSGGGEWVIGGAQDGVIGKVYRAPGKEDAVPSSNWTDADGSIVHNLTVSSSNTDIQDLLEKEKVEKDEDITCEDKDGKLLQLGREDERICDGIKWDCREGRDERSCDYHTGLSALVLVSINHQDRPISSKINRLLGTYEAQHVQRNQPLYPHNANTTGYYKHTQDSIFIIRDRRAEKWILKESRSPSESKRKDYYVSKRNTKIPEKGWKEVMEGGRENEANIIVSSLPKSITMEKLSQTDVSFEEPNEGILCTAKVTFQQVGEAFEEKPKKRLFIKQNDEKECDATLHCEDGLDEAICNRLASNTIYPSVLITSAVLVFGCLAQIVRANWKWLTEAIRSCCKPNEPQRRKPEVVHKYSGITEMTAKAQVDDLIRSVLNTETEEGRAENTEEGRGENDRTNQYRELHEIDGGIRLLTGSGFCLLSTPNQRHRLARLISTEEKKIHGSDEEAVRCMRKKGHSSKEMALCLDSVQPPGKLKTMDYAMQLPMNWILTRDYSCAKIIAILLVGMLPILRITLYTWDFTKDTTMVIYLFDARWIFIEDATIRGLIVVYAISILASSLALCWTVQMTKENGIVNLAKIKNGRIRRMARLLLLILTPIIPLCIIFRSVRLTMKTKKMVANWRKNQDTKSPSSAWIEIDILDKNKRNVKTALSSMKSAEANLEGTVQLFVLLCLYFIPLILPEKSGLGPEFEQNNQSAGVLVLLIFSPIVTLISNIAANIAAIDICKGRQLGFKSKSLIGLYLLCQLASHLCRMVPTVLASLDPIGPMAPALSPLHAAFLLLVPVLVNWFLIIMLMSDRITNLPGMINHLIREGVKKVKLKKYNKPLKCL